MILPWSSEYERWICGNGVDWMSMCSDFTWTDNVYSHTKCAMLPSNASLNPANQHTAREKLLATTTDQSSCKSTHQFPDKSQVPRALKLHHDNRWAEHCGSQGNPTRTPSPCARILSSEKETYKLMILGRTESVIQFRLQTCWTSCVEKLHFFMLLSRDPLNKLFPWRASDCTPS